MSHVLQLIKLRSNREFDIDINRVSDLTIGNQSQAREQCFVYKKTKCNQYKLKGLM